MGMKPEYTASPERPDSTDFNTILNRSNVDSDATPPIYYDSEPTAQPPRYPDERCASSNDPQTALKSRHKPTNQQSTGASASTIAAVLGSGYADLDAERRANRKKKTLRERWIDFKGRNFSSYNASEDRAGAGSAPEWNVQGGTLNGGLASPYRKQQGK
ncbi:hypothetical protein E8E13_010708 [Curvularia kusanoi]|uniref:Uncharacterized protein n=1 Tax=Curvularia kusanoi TaxID=90978 RepID=A0A9P4TPW2_CURKU|nr:hypothetical protein E8E13_010708 [Curvularia kusanoi]